MSRNISRRRFVAALAALAAPLAGCARGPGRSRRAARLVELVGDAESAAAIGSAYLAGRPATDLGDLLGEVYARLGWGSRFASDEDLAARAADRLDADLAEGRWLTVEKWRLADMEVRICALAAALEGGASEAGG